MKVLNDAIKYTLNYNKKKGNNVPPSKNEKKGFTRGKVIIYLQETVNSCSTKMNYNIIVFYPSGFSRRTRYDLNDNLSNYPAIRKNNLTKFELTAYMVEQ